MRKLSITPLLVVITVSLLLVACSQAAPSTPAQAPTAAKAVDAAKPAVQSAPTQTPATQSKPAEPTKATEAEKKVSFPDKGKSITILQPYPAGGGSDLACRILASLLEKDLGVPVQVVAKPGAGTQVGHTEMAKAKPDGYTLGYVVLPDVITCYQNPDRQAVFNRESYAPVALHAFDPVVYAVKTDSSIKSMNDAIDKAKANPEKVKISTFGVLTPVHLVTLELEKLTNAKFAVVHFDGAAPTVTNLLGGHIDVGVGYAGAFAPAARSGQLRAIGIADKEENQFFPGAKTLEAQGFKQYVYKASSICVPKGTPKEIIDVLTKAIKRAMDTEEHKQKMEEAGQTLRYMGPEEFSDYWINEEARFKPLMEDALKAEKK